MIEKFLYFYGYVGIVKLKCMFVFSVLSVLWLCFLLLDICSVLLCVCEDEYGCVYNGVEVVLYQKSLLLLDTMEGNMIPFSQCQLAIIPGLFIFVYFACGRILQIQKLGRTPHPPPPTHPPSADNPELLQLFLWG